MNRSVWIIAVLGLASAVVLSFMMERALTARQRHDANPVATAVDRALGSRCNGPASYRVRLRDGSRTGLLTLRSLDGVHTLRLAGDAGALAWREIGRDQIDALMVVCVAETGGVERFLVPSPWSPGVPVVVLGPDQDPVPPSRARFAEPRQALPAAPGR